MIKENFKVTNISTLDIAPTILYLLGLPIPKDMDGRLIHEIIRPGYLLLYPPIYSEKNTQTEIIKEINRTWVKEMKRKLIELGYLK